MRIAVVTDPGQLNTAYRGLQPGGALQQAGHDVRMVVLDEFELTADALHGVDVVYVYRYFERSTQRLVRAARDAGAAIVWDNDDDMTYFPDDSITTMRKGALRSQEALAKTKAMCTLADVVTTPSRVLADSYRSLGAGEVHVVENHVIDLFLGTERVSHPGVVVGWVGCAEHGYDNERIGIADTLARLLDAHGDVRVESVGIDLGLPAERSRCHGYVAFHELPAAIAGFDVGIAPIVDEPCNQARSNVKVKEYSALGIPWLASPIGPYAGLGEKQGGRLVADDGWFEALDRLVTKGRERKRLGKAAARWAREQAIGRHVGRWDAVVEAAVARRGAAAATAR
jgi:glycosyltransferase involved in cell wall biosynthesis